MSQRMLSFSGVSTIGALTLCPLLAFPAAARQVDVPGTAMPWISNSMLNAARPFGQNDGTAPVAVSLNSLHVHEGDTVTVTYVSGTVSGGKNLPLTDANGDEEIRTDHNGREAEGRFPSYYMKPYYPIYLCELVGTFTDHAGKIVGKPLRFADGPTQFTVPRNARFLQLGANDNVFADNTGSWQILVSTP